MPILDLTLAGGRTNYSESTSAPDNGNNTFRHNWDLDASKISADQIELEVIPQGPSVTAARMAFTALRFFESIPGTGAWTPSKSIPSFAEGSQ